MARIRYFIRAFFLGQALAGMGYLVHLVDRGGRLEANLPAIAGTVVLLGLPLALLWLRELTRVVLPPEDRRGMPLVGGRYEGGFMGLLWTAFRGVVGAQLLVGAAFLGMSVQPVLVVPVALSAWMIGFGERRATFVPSLRVVLQEGWLLPAWTSLDNIRCASVHVTAYHRPGHQIASSHTFCPVLLEHSGGLIELGDLVTDLAQAERISEHAATAMNIAFQPNRPAGYASTYGALRLS